MTQTPTPVSKHSDTGDHRDDLAHVVEAVDDVPRERALCGARIEPHPTATDLCPTCELLSRAWGP